MPTAIRNERLTLTKAVPLYGKSKRKLWQLLSNGTLTDATPPAERGPGKARFIWADEVEVLRTQGEAACKQYRLEKGRG